LKAVVPKNAMPKVLLPI